MLFVPTVPPKVRVPKLFVDMVPSPVMLKPAVLKKVALVLPLSVPATVTTGDVTVRLAEFTTTLAGTLSDGAVMIKEPTLTAPEMVRALASVKLKRPFGIRLEPRVALPF